MAALGEFERGKLTGQNIADAFGLSAPELAEAGSLIAKIVTPLEAISIGGFVTFINVGATYDAVSASQGLGFVRVQTAGITGFEFTVRVNKIGTGTQSWQLWNETDAAEITVINDAGATGIKLLSIQHTFPSALLPGFKTVRVRAKSTTANDDPVYFGACVLVNRIERMSAEELHEVLLLAETGVAYGTVVSLKARLGVV